MKILVTGAAGFIGASTVKKLLEEDNEVIGIDNINDYYDPKLKYKRLDVLGIDDRAEIWGNPVISHIYPEFTFIRMDIADKEKAS